MKYVVFAFLAALVIGIIRLFFAARAQRIEPHQIVPKANRLISTTAIPNHQPWRNHAEVTAPQPTASTSKRRKRADIQVEVGIRDDLKAACKTLLEQAALEHPAGHTASVGRYVMRSKNGDRIEILFDTYGKGRAKLWIAQHYAGPLINAGIEVHVYPASNIYKTTDEGTRHTYGRHSALKSMRDLANADLVRFTISKVDQLEVILANLAFDV